MTRPTLLLLACLAVLPAAVSAQNRVYTWVDAGGVRHYSQTPPPKGTATERDIKTREGTASTAAEPAKPRSQAEQSCAEARVNAQTLASSMAVSSDKDGDGKAEILSPTERDQAAAAAQAQIDLYCGKG